jgi:hypothetical protein
MTTPFLSIDLDGPDLLAELTSIAGAIGPEITALNAEIGQAIEDAADGPTPVRTGALLRSIFWEVDGPAGLIVGPHLDYGEFIHRRIPYMLIAYQLAEPTIDRILDRAGDHIVEAR